jgi:hypothetical protein
MKGSRFVGTVTLVDRIFELSWTVNQKTRSDHEDLLSCREQFMEGDQVMYF